MPILLMIILLREFLIVSCVLCVPQLDSFLYQIKHCLSLVLYGKYSTPSSTLSNTYIHIIIYFEGRTLFLQLGCFGLDFTSFCICIPQIRPMAGFGASLIYFFSLPQEQEKMKQM